MATMNQPEPSTRRPTLSTREDSEPLMLSVPLAILRYLFETVGDEITLDRSDVLRLNEGIENYKLYVEQDPDKLRFKFQEGIH